MKIVITTANNKMTSKIPAEFKDARYLLFINTEENNQYFVPNMFYRSISGAEIFCSNFLIKHETELFACGEYDQQAKELLTLGGIKVLYMPNSSINEVMQFINKQVVGGAQ